jgi:hypothetical protein
MKHTIKKLQKKEMGGQTFKETNNSYFDCSFYPR